MRSSNIELLRLVLMFMIVILHIYIAGLYSATHTDHILLESFMCSIGILGVNCYIFISGYFGIRTKTQALVSLFVQSLFYALLFCVLTYLFGKEDFSLSFLVKSLLPIPSGLWWFLTGYVCLYIVSPFLNLGFKYLNRRSIKLLCLSLLFFDCISGFILNVPFIGNSGYCIFHFITIYCVARYMNTYNSPLKQPLLITLACILLIWGMFVCGYLSNGHRYYQILYYSNPIIIIGAISLFYTFKNIKLSSSFINKIAPLSFGVYLIHVHPFIKNNFTLKIINFLSDKYEDKIVFIFLSLFLLCIIIFVSCLFIEKIRVILCNRFIIRITNKLNNYNLDIIEK